MCEQNKQRNSPAISFFKEGQSRVISGAWFLLYRETERERGRDTETERDRERGEEMEERPTASCVSQQLQAKLSVVVHSFRRVGNPSLLSPYKLYFKGQILPKAQAFLGYFRQVLD